MNRIVFLFGFVALVGCNRLAPPSSSQMMSNSQEPAGHTHTHAPGMAHADHNPRHGGTLSMIGDNHIETVVKADGRVEVYVSNARRVEAPATELSGTITRVIPNQPAQPVTLRQDTAAGALVADGLPAAGMTRYEYDVVWHGEHIRGSALVPAGGNYNPNATASAGHEHGGAHEHGSPHGGVMVSATGGHVEAKLERSGRVTVWLFDDNEQQVSAQGATATVRLATADATDVALTYDAQQNALVGNVPAIPSAPNAVAVVTVTRSGGAPASSRFNFPLSNTQ